MSQTTIDLTYRRLGLWVGYRRKQLLNQTKLARYRQTNFIQTSRLHPYFEYPSGHAVCSRTTLSNLEHGGLLRESSLLPYFMKKLGISVRFSESTWLATHVFYERLEFDLKSNEAFSSSFWLYELEKHATASYDDILFRVECPWAKAFLRWIENPRLDTEVDFEEFIEVYPILNPVLQGILSDWLAFLILTQAHEWPHAMKYLKHLIDDGNHGRLVISIWHLFKGNAKDSFEYLNEFMGEYGSGKRFGSVFVSYLNLLYQVKPTDISKLQGSESVPNAIFHKTHQTIDLLKTRETKLLVKILRHEPYPHFFRKQWILEMAWHMKVSGQYKRFLELFVELHSINQGLE